MQFVAPKMPQGEEAAYTTLGFTKPPAYWEFWLPKIKSDVPPLSPTR
jgi:hypothetical protein